MIMAMLVRKGATLYLRVFLAAIHSRGHHVQYTTSFEITITRNASRAKTSVLTIRNWPTVGTGTMSRLETDLGYTKHQYRHQWIER